MAFPLPAGCDSFVAFPPATGVDSIVFGKNSDRSWSEPQQVVYLPREQHVPGDLTHCTQIRIPQAPVTWAVFLSQPTWLWGAEMGCNEHGVCIGNEAVWTVEILAESRQKQPRGLLGMDLVRLGLERSKTAAEALQVITSLLEQYGQAGSSVACGSPANWQYHNSFIIADRKEAWILETAGRRWAAEHVTGGVRHLSNTLSIGTKIDVCSEGLKEYAQKQGYWNPQKGPFNFALAFGSHHTYALLLSHAWYNVVCLIALGFIWALVTDFWRTVFNLLTAPPVRRLRQVARRFASLRHRHGEEGYLSPSALRALMCDRWTGICMDGAIVSTGSMIAVVSRTNKTGDDDVFWFTGTANPAQSVFKPVNFPRALAVPEATVIAPLGLWRLHERWRRRWRQQRASEWRKLQQAGWEAKPVGIETFCEFVRRELEIYQC
eukprot:TRINITY_DN93765_c0_g1_i1.p1 TRINITY_DN93765_c0_g1~~TRINITY_DN93765_c0_g1_i1.p1  ORF type:complete len:434 (-),score=62.71 TRINITY_DN93765_c0_g1_i1:156-1457(-)